MKIIRTCNGMKKIVDGDVHSVSVQLKSILQKHQATLIDKLIAEGLERYIDYKFNTKATFSQLQEIEERLMALKSEGMHQDIYPPILDIVLKHDFTSISDSIVYKGIDEIIRKCLFQFRFFNVSREVFFQ